MGNPEQLRTGPHGVHRGFRWELGRSLGAVVLSSVLGVLFGALCGAGLGLWQEAMFIACVAGAVVGFACSPVLTLVTTSRDAGVGVLLVTLVTGGAGVLAGSLGRAYDGMWWGVLATILVYVAVCVGWRMWSGTGAWTPSMRLCRGCGYDLVGLTGPVCPECGEACPVSLVPTDV